MPPVPRLPLLPSRSTSCHSGLPAACAVGLLVLALSASASWLPAMASPATEEAQERSPSRPDLHQPPPPPLPPPGEMARCKELIDAGLYEAARSRLEPIVDQHPGWARATGLLALTYYRQNRFEAARSLFARALEADPDEIAIRPLYGWTLYSLGDLDAAEEMFESLLQRLPAYTVAHYALGLIHLDRDELSAARDRFGSTARLAAGQEDPVMAGRAHARLGDLHLRNDELAAARRELELAVELFPDEANAHFALSRVLQRLGDDEGAAQARKRFEEADARLRLEAPRLPE